MSKKNVFRFGGNADRIQQWQRSFAKIGGKIYNVVEDKHFTGTLTAKQLPTFREYFLVDESHLKSFDTFPKESCMFHFISDRSINCGCNNGYWMVHGEWCACYDCKGRGWRYPEEGYISLEKDYKPESRA